MKSMRLGLVLTMILIGLSGCSGKPVDNLNDSIAEFDIEYDRRKAIREAVPGAYVMERTGLTGKDLGSLIDMIKVTYDNALIGVTQDQLNYYIDTCHNTYKSGQS